MGEFNDAVTSIIDLAAQTKCGQVITAEPGHFILVPDGYSLLSVEQFQHADKPARKTGRVTFVDVPSFSEYFSDFADPDSQIFGDPERHTVTAILDYHKIGDGDPRFCQHRATLNCTLTEEWETWIGGNNKQLDQTAFALFLEDNLLAIVDPPGAQMLDVARFLKATNKVDFESDVNLANGQVQFKYHETVQGRIRGGEGATPEAFTLRLAIFRGGRPRDVTARLRWRITADKKLIFWYTLVGAKRLLEDAFAETLESVQHATERTVLLGSFGS